MKRIEMTRLAKAVLSLKTESEVQAFFEDLCTIQEIEDMTQRLDVAMCLDEGMTYAAIAEETGASTATVSRVNKSLSYGADGYRTVLDRMKNSKADKEAEDGLK